MLYFKRFCNLINQKDSLTFFENRNQKLFIPLALTGTVALAICTLLNFINGMTYVALINIPPLICMILGVICFKRKMHTMIYASLVFGSVFVVISVQHYISPPEIQSNLMWFPILTLVAFYLIPVIYAPFIFIFAITTALLGYALPLHPALVHINEYQNSNITHIVNISSILISTLVALIIGVKISIEDASNFFQLNKRNSKLLDLNETNTALLSILSHDMNNYISIIKSHTKMLLKKNEGNEDVKKHTDKISNAILQVQELTNQVKTMRATDSGKLTIEIRPIKIKPAVIKVVETFKETINKKHIVINFLTNIPDNTKIYAESVSLQSSVIANLISNAIKFSSENSAISVILGKHDNKVQLTVKDTGVGIPPDLLKNIFSKTAATTRIGTSGEKGTGFGMPILKMYIDKYEAEININSTTEGPFRGTEFVISFRECSIRDEMEIKKEY